MTDQYVDEDFDDYADGEYAGQPDEDYVDEFEDRVDRRPFRSGGSTEVEGRTSWYYLGLLGGLFIVLVFFSWACNDRSSDGPVETEAATEVTPGSEAVRLAIDVDGDVVTLRGAVPDEAAREQILDVTRTQYGAENVIDELTVDAATVLEGGSVSMSGSADFADERPEALRQTIATDLGLDAADFSIDRGEAAASAVEVTIQVDGASILLSGGVPDQASIDDLTAAAEAVWGAGNVDGGGLVVSDTTTWTDGVVRATGTASPGDTRADGLQAEIQSRFGALVTVDVTGVAADDDPAALTAVEEEINDQLGLQPIRFAPLSADIEAESDAVLIDIAAKLNDIPAVSVEVVGHTDNAGSEQENLVLSQQRADAVIARLVEIGVDAARLNARGEGEEFPIADNDTPEGREQNRRIEFRLAAG